MVIKPDFLEGKAKSL